MKVRYLALFLVIAPLSAMEKMSFESLFVVTEAMARTIPNFDLKNAKVVKKPMVELAEVDFENKRYLICLRSGLY